MRLTLIDTTGIQAYVFGSNRLREILGASHLVDSATGKWINECAQSNGNINDGAACETVYCGGGNALLIFKDKASEESFIRVYSRKVLCDAPGLKIAIESIDFDWSKDAIGGKGNKLQELQQKMQKAKQSLPATNPLLGLSVTTQCRSTGLPANRIARVAGEDFPASHETLAKLDASHNAKERLNKLVPPGEIYHYPDDLDDLGRSHGEHSFIGIVHADGDGMGKRVKAVIENHSYSEASSNRAFIKKLSDFSTKLEKAATNALQKTINKLIGAIDGDEIKDEDISIKLKEETILPFRPIVFGGDDVTFVCDGRLGVSLAVEYMKEFEQETDTLMKEYEGKATACSGIALVKSHFPFSRAYELAEDLCKNAKNYKKKESLSSSCLDWHFAGSGLNSSLSVLRNREYQTAHGSLTLRPLSLNRSQPSWETVLNGIFAFRGEGWHGRRNKLKTLREVLRAGPDAVQEFITHYNENAPLPEIDPSISSWKTSGWHGHQCGYYDAIEMVDWHVNL